jgi:predicted membrane-bound spermidine synthase
MKLLIILIGLLGAITCIAAFLCFYLNHEKIAWTFFVIFTVLAVLAGLFEKYMWWSTLGW